MLIFYSAVVDSKNLWSGFPNPLLPPLTQPGGLENPPQTTNNAGAFDRLVCFEFLGGASAAAYPRADHIRVAHTAV